MKWHMFFVCYWIFKKIGKYLKLLWFFEEEVKEIHIKYKILLRILKILEKSSLVEKIIKHQPEHQSFELEVGALASVLQPPFHKYTNYSIEHHSVNQIIVSFYN